MPNTTPAVKKTAVLGYGANVIECEPLQSIREQTVGYIQFNQNYVITDISFYRLTK
jgi:threonine dehydratase